MPCLELFNAHCMSSEKIFNEEWCQEREMHHLEGTELEIISAIMCNLNDQDPCHTEAPNSPLLLLDALLVHLWPCLPPLVAAPQAKRPTRGFYTH